MTEEIWSASNMGCKGGTMTKKRYGLKHFSEIGKKGGRPKGSKNKIKHE